MSVSFIHLILLLGVFSLARKWSAMHKVIYVCTKGLKMLISYAAPRMRQSLWKTAQWAFYICKLHKNLSVPHWIKCSILLVILISENLRFFIWKAWRKHWQDFCEKSVTKLSSDCKKEKRKSEWKINNFILTWSNWEGKAMNVEFWIWKKTLI